MIGKYVRGFRHFSRNVEDKPHKFLFSVGNHGMMVGEAIKVPHHSKGIDVIYVFQNFYDNSRLDIEDYKGDIKVYDSMKELRQKYPYVLCVVSSRDFGQVGNKTVILPKDFNDGYSAFLKNNRKQIDPLMKKYNMTSEHAILMYLYCLCHNSPNFFVWAMKNIFSHRVSLNNIEKIIRWNDNYSQLVSKLNKGTITAYNGRDAIMSLLDEMKILRRNKRANDVINLFNTAQKKILKNETLNEQSLNILGKFGRISKVKQLNFIRKMSTVYDFGEILHQMAFLVNIHFEWNKESFIDYINNADGINCEIVFNNENLVLVKVNDYETIKKLAKNTNWCISKNKRYWNDYVEYKHGDAIQYMLCDFSKKEDDHLSIIGFTTMLNRGITNAHNFINNNLMGSDNGAVSRLRSIFQSSSNIYNILHKCNIPLSKVIKIEDAPYPWCRDGFIDYLNSCVSEENYTIFYDENNKLVISVEDSNVRYVLGEFYMERMDSDTSSKQHFLFLDFNRQITDPEKFLYGIIYENCDTGESYCSELRNEFGQTALVSFENKLSEHNLPYTIICRTDSLFSRFVNAFENYDVDTMRELLKHQEVVDELKARKDKGYGNEIYSTMEYLLCQYKTLDYLYAFYDNNIKLGDIMPSYGISRIAYNLYSNVVNRYRELGRKPNEEDIDNLLNNRLNDSKAFYVGLYLMLKLMMEHETTPYLYERVSKKLLGFYVYNDLTSELISHILNVIDIKDSSYDYMTVNILQVIASNQMDDLLDIILEKGISDYYHLKTIVGYLSPSNNRFAAFKQLLEKNTPSQQYGTFSFNDASNMWTVTNSSFKAKKARG